MNAVEKIIMQGILRSVADYNNSIEVLTPGVEKYFEDHYDDVWWNLYEWHLDDSGNNIEITYTRRGSGGDIERNTDTIPTETIVSIAVELSFNKY